jgi:predicted transcriptional regulator
MNETLARLAAEYIEDPTNYIESRNIEYPEVEAEEHTVIDHDTNTMVSFSAAFDEHDNPILVINSIDDDALISPEDLEKFKSENAELYAMFASRVNEGIPVRYTNEQQQEVDFPGISR